MSDSFSLVIVNPENIEFEDEVKKVMVPGTMQTLAILPDHAPLYAQLVKGQVIITKVDNSIQTLNLESGIMRVKLNKVSIITGIDAKGEVQFGD